MRITVLLATMLLITAIGQRFRFKAARVTFMILACLLLCLLFGNCWCCRASNARFHYNFVSQADFSVQRIVVAGPLLQRMSHNCNVTVLAAIAQKSYDQSPIARQYAPSQNEINYALLRASLRAKGWPARCNSSVDIKRKPGDTNEIQTIYS